MLNLSPAAFLEKNRLASDGAWLVLLEIAVFGLDQAIRVVRNTEDVEWPSGSGRVWTAFPFELDEIGEDSKGEVPRVVVRVSNVTRAVQAYLEQADGGVGASVTIRVVHGAHLDLPDPEVELVFEALEARTDSRWAEFTLGAANPFRRRFPQNRALKNFCRFKFKSPECGYVGEVQACGKTLAECRELNNSRRFGGFPGVGLGGFYA